MAKKTYYYAEQEDATVIIDNFNATASTITANINHNGTPKIGYVEIVEGKPVFTEGEMPEGTKSTVEEMIKKHKFALFIDSQKNELTKDWVRIGKATEFNRNYNAQTEENDYIEDEYATTEVTAVKPSEAMTVKTIKNHPDFEVLYVMAKKRATGVEAHRDILTVFMFDSVEVETTETADVTE